VQQSRNAIALLITVMFVIVITVAIGYGLKQVNTASAMVKEENFIYQNNITIEDVLTILQNSQELQRVADSNSSEELYLLLSEAAFIPFEYKGIEILLRLKSARAKFNPKILNAQRAEMLRLYLQNYNINGQYVDMLFDNIGGIKEDNSYTTAIFDENPSLFRDYIASAKHLELINDFYTKEYNDNALKKVDFSQLFIYGDNNNSSIDLNFATPAVWEMMLGCSQDRAEVLSSGMGSYTDLQSVNLSSDEQANLAKFKTSFFEPIIEVELGISQNGLNSKVKFEYDMKNKKGSNFVYEI